MHCKGSVQRSIPVIVSLKAKNLLSGPYERISLMAAVPTWGMTT